MARWCAPPGEWLVRLLSRDARVRSVSVIVDIHDDNVDVGVELTSGAVSNLTLITPANISTLQQRWAISGESTSPFVIGNEHVLVPELSADVVLQAITRHLDDEQHIDDQ